MRISVVIPCYNAARWVADAIRSVMEQTYSPHEIIVIDDGSTDRSVEIVRSSGSDIKLIQTDHVHAAEARNIGIRAASGEWIAFLDADDRWYPCHLERASGLLGRSNDVAYISLMDLVDEAGTIRSARNPWPVVEPTQGLDHKKCIDFWLIERNFHSLITIVAQRERLLEIGGFDVSQVKAHDVEMWMRLIHDCTWSYDPKATAIHATERPGGITQSGWALSQYFVMRGFLNNRDRYGASPSYDRMLQRTARETINAALLFGDVNDQKRINEIAWAHLSKRHRMLFGTLGRSPTLYRFAHRIRRQLKMAATNANR